MPSLTIKNIPDELYEKLKNSAYMNHRSINSELIVCLETVLMPKQYSISERIKRAQELRSSIVVNQINLKDIQKAIKQGRQ